jgi:hypothetical protein
VEWIAGRSETSERTSERTREGGRSSVVICSSARALDVGKGNVATGRRKSQRRGSVDSAQMSGSRALSRGLTCKCKRELPVVTRCSPLSVPVRPSRRHAFYGPSLASGEQSHLQDKPSPPMAVAALCALFLPCPMD